MIIQNFKLIYQNIRIKIKLNKLFYKFIFVKNIN